MLAVALSLPLAACGMGRAGAEDDGTAVLTLPSPSGGNALEGGAETAPDEAGRRGPARLDEAPTEGVWIGEALGTARMAPEALDDVADMEADRLELEELRSERAVSTSAA